ncbi:norbelladine synthase-like [Cornus florida]|uniref:norbelladine synthase-like n=1 Tax=Cornus florida TaxID=4283 RepID=UPI0028999309|nr:norbelladine synthase-like [Cornus florida]
MNKVSSTEYQNKHITTHQEEIRKMFGAVSEEIEVKVSATEAWQLYGTLRLAKLLEEELTDDIHKVEIIHGDGDVGTIVKLTFPPELGTSDFSYYKEKITKIDDEKRVKEAEAIEGVYIDVGFSLFRVRFEVTEKSENSCITKTTIEYEIKEEASANTSLVSIEPMVKLMEVAANYLVKNKK